MKKLYFYTKKGCPLCDEGLIVVKELQSAYSIQIEERDIYTNDNWLELYQIRIPVVEDEDGNVLDEGIISKESLEKKFKEVLK